MCPLSLPGQEVISPSDAPKGDAKERNGTWVPTLSLCLLRTPGPQAAWGTHTVLLTQPPPPS